MGWRDLGAGWHRTRLSGPYRLECQQRLEQVLEGMEPQAALERVHGVVRSSIRLHTRVHWTSLRLHWRCGELGGVLRAVPPMMLAPVSSLGRRLGGLDSKAPQDASLAETWSRVVRIACAGGPATDR